MIHLHEIDGKKIDIDFESVFEMIHFLENYFDKKTELCKKVNK